MAMNVSALRRLSPLALPQQSAPKAAPSASEVRLPEEQVFLSTDSKRTQPGFFQQVSRALIFGTVAVASLAGAVTAQAQVQVQQAPQMRGVQFDQTREQVDLATRNSVTAEQIPEGQPHFTAWDVDPNQSSKWYHNPETLAQVNGYGGQTRTEGERFRMCTRFTTTGNCASALMNQVSYSVLSCIYYKQEDGQFYRVTHKSYQHQQTHAMQRNVCGGHELRREGGEFATWAPSQVTKDGDQLFLNPANILRVERVANPNRG
jgi:hypothetical protein